MHISTLSMLELPCLLTTWLWLRIHPLQSLINLVHSYTIKWRYKINPAKSAILVFGEATRTRSTNRGLISWSIGSATISEQDEVHHLGILRSVHSSTISRTNERASSGTRFGCLHPSTSLKLYNVVCLPIMLFGSEIWNSTKTEVLMLERVHRKILRTIQGFPLRCPASGLRGLAGSMDIQSYISQRNLSFIFSIISLQPDVLVRKLLTERITTPTTDGVIPRWNSLLELYSLPSITELLTKPPCSKHTWKKSCRSILASIHYNLMFSDCKSLPLAQCSSKSFTTCKIVHQWLISKGDRQMFRRSNLRIRLLVGCEGLEADTARFRYRKSGLQVGDPTCKLCHVGAETPQHFTMDCAALQDCRTRLLSQAPHSLAGQTLACGRVWWIAHTAVVTVECILLIFIAQ